MQEELYSRQIRLPEIGLEGQRSLTHASLLLVGIGGLGCAALPSLAAAGIGRIGLVDDDLVELSNLPRQTLFGPSDLGKNKAQTALERLSPLYPHVQFIALPTRLTPSNAKELIHSYDLVLDATDNSASRYAINDACRSLRLPWVYGAIERWEGQVSLFQAPGPDYRSLFPEERTEPECTCSQGGVLGAFVSLIGSIQACEAIKWIVGLEETLRGKLLRINGKTWRSTLLSLSPPSAASWELSFPELQQRLSTIHLIDVREPHEKLYGDLGGLLIPFDQFSIDHFNSSLPIVLYCQHGIRSALLAQRLRRAGYEAYSLAGGVAAALRGSAP